MRCKYTKLFREICSVLQISYVFGQNLQCFANFLCFWVKFAVLCKFLSVKLITLSVICISENLYLFGFIARNILSFLLPETSYSMRIYKPMSLLSY